MNQILVSHEIPLIYEKLSMQFGVDWDKGLIIACEGKIHCKNNPEPQKIIHEAVHLNEQKEIGEEAWWRLYLESPDFRLQQEVLAYKAEVDFLKKYVKNREHRFFMVKAIVDALTSSMYGNLISREEAFKLFK